TIGMITFFARCALFFKTNQGKRNKWLVNFLMISIPVSIILIFLKLYQAADKDFNDLTAFLNLDFISWGSILLYLLLSIFLFGFFFYQHVNDLNEIETKLSNDISAHKEDR